MVSVGGQPSGRIRETQTIQVQNAELVSPGQPCQVQLKIPGEPEDHALRLGVKASSDLPKKLYGGLGFNIYLLLVSLQHCMRAQHLTLAYHFALRARNQNSHLLLRIKRCMPIYSVIHYYW